MGDFSLPQRCILSCTNLSTTQTVLAVQSDAVWFGSRPEAFYQLEGNGGNRPGSEVTSDSHFHVPKQLVNQEPRPSRASISKRFSSEPASQLDLAGKLEEVSVSSDSKDRLLWSSFQSKQGISIPIRRKVSKSFGLNGLFSESSSHSSTLLGIITACIELIPLTRLHMQPVQLYIPSLWQLHRELLGMIYISQTMVIQPRRTSSNTLDRCFRDGMGGGGGGEKWQRHGMSLSRTIT